MSPLLAKIKATTLSLNSATMGTSKVGWLPWTHSRRSVTNPRRKDYKMAIRFNDAPHAAGEQTSIGSFALMDALAWWIGSELMRRHPGELFLRRTGSEFQYNVLAVTRRMAGVPGRSREVGAMNRQPGSHLTTGTWFDNSSSTKRFNWLEILASPDRFKYVVEQLEKEAGLRSPTSAPATVASSVGPRLIAGFLVRTIFTRKKWVALAGLEDSGMGEAWTHDTLFQNFPGTEQLIPSPSPNAYVEGDYRFWFLCPTEPGKHEQESSAKDPTVAIDIDHGLLWTQKTPSPVNLIDAYNKAGRSMDALISAVCPPAY